MRKDADIVILLVILRHWIQVRGKLQAPAALYPGKEPSYPPNRCWVVTKVGLELRRKVKPLLRPLSQQAESQFSSRPAHSLVIHRVRYPSTT
jgi:hypothetical protein